MPDRPADTERDLAARGWHWLSREASRLVGAARAIRPPRRYLLGIAGLPGSGKTTLAEALAGAINGDGAQRARVVGMDGFHLSNAALEAAGLRGWKGTPATFDPEGYRRLLQRAQVEPDPLVFPVYVRGPERRPGKDPVRWANRPEQRIEPWTRIVIGEGNFLLLDERPWPALAAVFDELWWLNTPAEVALRRIAARHAAGGRSSADIEAQQATVDRPNVQRILANRLPADRVVSDAAVSAAYRVMP